MRKFPKSIDFALDPTRLEKFIKLASEAETDNYIIRAPEMTVIVCNNKLVVATMSKPIYELTLTDDDLKNILSYKKNMKLEDFEIIQEVY